MQTITLRVAENGGSVPMTPEQVRIIEAVSPTVDVERVAGGLRITIHDLHGAHSAELADGTPGDPGYSPIVSISPIAGGHRVTITDTEGTHAFDVMDGDDYTLTAEDRAAIAGMTAGLVSVPVQDVQIDGTSILNNGVANVPVAGTGAAGVLRVANDSDTKSGNSAQRINTPYRQHAATFYGLAKAAGDSTQSASSNAVGTYTADALVKIQKMLGVYREWELIADVTVAEDSALVDINTDISGQPFNLSKMLVRAWLEPATTGNNSYVSANCLVTGIYDEAITSPAPSKRYMTNGAKTFFEYVAEVMGGICYVTGTSTNVPNNTNSVEKISSVVSVKSIRGFRMSKFSDASSFIPANSVIKIYGIRA